MSRRYPEIPWIAPFFAYLLLSQVAASAPEELYPWLHLSVVVVSGAVAFFLLRGKGIIRPHRDIMPGIIAGMAGIIIWVYLCGLDIDSTLTSFLPEWIRPGMRVAFNPFEQIENPVARWLFIGARLVGMSIVVPVAEELFWRGWLMRWIISHRWQEVAIGTFSIGSFLWVTFLFTMAHPEWLAAACWCAMINLLLYWKKDLWNCIVAHGVTNFLLAVYVMRFDAWQLW